MKIGPMKKGFINEFIYKIQKAGFVKMMRFAPDCKFMS